MSLPNLCRKNTFVDNPILIEGTARSGKFLLGNLMAGIDGIEGVQWIGMVEQLAHLYHLGWIEKAALQTIIQIQLDNLGYQRMIGRNLNFRYDDKTSIYNSPNPKLFLERCLGRDGEFVAHLVKKNNLAFSFLVHDAFQDIDVFLEVSPNLKVLRMERNPIDLVFSWFKRGWGRRLGTDPLDCTVHFEGKKGSVPWFTYGSEEKYENATEMDRIINILFSIGQMTKNCYERLSDEQKKRIHIISYERLLTQTDAEVGTIATFLNRKILPQLKTIKLKENLPIKHPRYVRQNKEKEIVSLASKEALSLLRKMEKEYCERWDD